MRAVSNTWVHTCAITYKRRVLIGGYKGSRICLELRAHLDGLFSWVLKLVTYRGC